jgi:anti-sigma B factor antagonist
MSPHCSAFSAHVVHENGSLLLALAGELDIATAPVLRRTVVELLSPHLRAVTLDLGALTFVDLIGLRALLEVRQMAVGADVEFRLVSVSDFTLRIIRLAQFDALQSATELV